MSAKQEYNIKVAFNNMNNLKRAYTLGNLEKNKAVVSPSEIARHELDMLKAMLQLELSLRTIQNEYREGAVHNDSNSKM